jgi:hypothetical protein
MTETVTALLIEGLVAVLLAITIGYCYVLDRRLRTLKGDRAALEAVVAEMVAASGAAERAIGALRQAVVECNQELADKLVAGDKLREDLAAELMAAKEAARLLAKAVPAAPPAPAPAPIVVPAPAPEPVRMVPAANRMSETVAAARSLAQRFQERVQHGAAA